MKRCPVCKEGQVQDDVVINVSKSENVAGVVSKFVDKFDWSGAMVTLVVVVLIFTVGYLIKKRIDAPPDPIPPQGVSQIEICSKSCGQARFKRWVDKKEGWMQPEPAFCECTDVQVVLDGGSK